MFIYTIVNHTNFYSRFNVEL